MWCLHYNFVNPILIILCNVLFVQTKYSRHDIEKENPGFGKEWLPISDGDGNYVIGYMDSTNSSTSSREIYPNPSEIVKFILYTRETPKNGTIIDNFLKIPSAYNRKKPTKFITHGWMSSGYSNTCQTIKNNYLNKYNLNVIIMDWGEIAKNILYHIPMHATYAIGVHYAKLLNSLIDGFGGSAKHFHLIGHSLGAHVSGFAARKVKNGRIGRITGLDPANPGFTPIWGVYFVEGERLKQTDAQFVDVIHTCAGYLGYEEPIGHVDFYPNGGQPPQPGCDSIWKFAEACSHGKSWIYFAESIISNVGFVALKCNNKEMNRCNQSERALMGDPCPPHANGIYSLQTISEPPYIFNTIF